jgi:hypothetical protein
LTKADYKNNAIILNISMISHLKEAGPSQLPKLCLGTSARVVLPDGNVRKFDLSELDVVADAEGITGMISEIVVGIQPLEDMEIIAVGCPDPHNLQKLFQIMRFG